MNTRKNIFILLALISAAPSLYCSHVGLCIMATGKYLSFAERLINSARTYFCPEDTVTYYVFTDGQLENPAPDIVTVPQQRLGWPYDTLMRNAIYLGSWRLFEGLDYIFAVDADMLFVAPVGREIFGERVGTTHPGFYNKPGTYETNKASTAAVKPHEGKRYFAGGFFGGSHDGFLHILMTTTKNITTDLEKNIIAVWHDESHLNRYFIDYPPTTILSPSYCYPERWSLPFTKKLLALDKDHAAMRK